MTTNTTFSTDELDFVIDLSTAPKRPATDPTIAAMHERLRAELRAAMTPPMVDYSGRRAPVLPAEPIAGGRVKVYCRFCKTFHYHGSPSADGTRHRSAPCGSQCGNDRSPYRTTGYLLHVVEPGYHAAGMRGAKGLRR